MRAPRFTVVAAFSGAVIGVDVPLEAAASSAAGYRNEPRVTLPNLAELKVGQSWHSHPGQSAGIRITRVA